MNDMQTLYFPGTEPAGSTLRRLLLFFDGVHFYQPMEGPSPAGLDGLIQSGLCHCYAPLPFGPDLDRFKRLLKDLGGHGDEYYSGMLSSLSRRSQPQVDQESVSRLIAVMAGGDVTTEKDTGEEKALWQARLFLALAERLSRDQREIEKGLLDLTSRQAGLFGAIKGDDDEDELAELSFSTLQLIKGVVPPPVKIDQQLAAWGRLYLSDSNEKPFALVTDQLAAAELVLEASAGYSATQPVCMGSMALPDIMCGQAEAAPDGVLDFIKRRELFRDTAGNCLLKLNEMIRQCMAQPDAGAKADEPGQASAAFGRLTAEWDRLIVNRVGQQELSSKLTVYWLPGMPLQALFQKIVHGASPSGQQPKTLTGSGILAVQSPICTD